MLNKQPQRPMPTLIGHRGLPINAPENTAASIKLAAQENITWVEIDVTMAGDGSLVIMHDAHLTRFGESQAALKDLTRRELQQVDAGGWFSDQFKGEPLLFLEDLLDLVKQLALGLNLEIKINPDLDCQQQVERIHSQLQQAQIANDMLIVSSFNLAALAQLRALTDTINIAVLFEKVPEDFADQVQPLKPISIHCHQGFLTQHQAQLITSHYPVYCYTVNDPTTLTKLLNWGVSGVFSDRAHAPDMQLA